jgi:hypothetical protein
VLKATLQKVTDLTAERDALAKGKADAEAALAKAQADLAARPKGALKAVPVEKSADTGAATAEPEPQDAIGLIRKSHRTPMVLR